MQGYNIRHAGLITFGKCWHGNHHAFPESAKMGVEHGQMDPGWWLISILSYLGLAREIKLPGSVPPRKEDCAGSNRDTPISLHTMLLLQPVCQPEKKRPPFRAAFPTFFAGRLVI